MTDALTLARHYVQSGNGAKALAALKGVDDAAAHAEAWALRAAAALSIERDQEGWEAAHRGLALEPDSLELLSLHAYGAMRLGRLAEAEGSALAALERRPDDPSLLCLYADVVARDGQVDKASKLVERAAGIDPESTSVMLARAELAYLRGDQRALERHAREMLSTDPEGRAGHHMQGVALANAGRFREAARHYAQIAGADPSDHGSAEIARQARAASHPLLWPMWPINRFGPWVVWAVGVGAMLLARSYVPAVAGPVTLIWLAYVVYTWVAPSLVERLVNR